MKKILFSIILIISANILLSFDAQGILQINLESPKNEYSLGEPAAITAKFINLSNNDLKIIFDFSRPRSFSININTDGKIRQDCIRRLEFAKMTELPSKIIKPNDSIQKEILLSEYGIVDEGVYDIWIVYDTIKLLEHSIKNDSPRIKIESNHFKIKLTRPIGLDLKAFEQYADKCNEVGEINLRLLKEFPTSIYAAWMIFGRFNYPEGWEPEKMKMLIGKNLFPMMNYIPDPYSPNGWRPITRKEAKEWQIKSAEQIVANHPDFPYARRLRLVIAVDTIALGDKEKGITLLQEIARDKDTREGQWASKFISLWN